MMKLAEFFQRFRDDQEIGRTITDDKLDVYYDNGQDVGRWVQDRRSQRSEAELLDDENAVTARHWYDRTRRQDAMTWTHRT
jgi:hypothetical protein